MPLKIDVGFHEKLGQPNYSSVGSSCRVEFEAESCLLAQDLKTFHDHVQHAFAVCRGAVEKELAPYRAARPPGATGCGAEDGKTSAATALCSLPRSNGNGCCGNGSSGNGSRGNGVTQRQLRYLEKLAGQIPGVGTERLAPMAEALFGKTLDRLDAASASEMIDLFKGVHRGEIDPRELIAGVAL